MAADMRRFTISITKNMEMELDEARKEVYRAESQNGMFRDLISRGLKDSESEKTAADTKQAD